MYHINVRPIERTDLTLAHVRIDRNGEQPTPLQRNERMFDECRKLRRVKELLCLVGSRIGTPNPSRWIVVPHAQRFDLGIAAVIAHLGSRYPDVSRCLPRDGSGLHFRVQITAQLPHVSRRPVLDRLVANARGNVLAVVAFAVLDGCVTARLAIGAP
jgi:hypothetical protein